MKKTIISIIVSLLVVVGVIYFFLVYAVNDKKNDLQEFKKKIEADSAAYHNRKVESNKALTP